MCGCQLCIAKPRAGAGISTAVSGLGICRRLHRRHEQQRDEGDGRRVAVLALHPQQDVPCSILYALGDLLPADALQEALHHPVKALHAQGEAERLTLGILGVSCLHLCTNPNGTVAICQKALNCAKDCWLLPLQWGPWVRSS